MTSGGRCPETRKLMRLEALDTVDQIAAAPTLEALFNLLAKRYAAFGFEHFILSGIPLPHQSLERTVLMRHWPKGWFDLYVERGFIKIDPTVRMAQSTVMPFAWSDAPFDPKQRRSTEVMKAARDFGLNQGFFLPIHGLEGRTDCVSLGGRKPDLDAATMPILHLISMYAFEHARQLFVAPPHLEINPLTPREQEVLTWAAVGKSYADIAEILRITERTVTAHAISATCKLGASNRTHAVVKAMKDRLIRV